MQEKSTDAAPSHFVVSEAIKVYMQGDDTTYFSGSARFRAAAVRILSDHGASPYRKEGATTRTSAMKLQIGLAFRVNLAILNERSVYWKATKS